MDDFSKPQRPNSHRSYERKRIDIARRQVINTYTKVSTTQETSDPPQAIEPNKRTQKSNKLKVLFNKLKAFTKLQIIKIRIFTRKHRLLMRASYGFIALVIVAGIIWQGFGWRFQDLRYELSKQAEALVGEPVEAFANQLQYDNKEKAFLYNKDFVPTAEGSTGQTLGAKFTAKFMEDPKKGMTIDDPVYKTGITFKPKFKIDEPRKQDNRLVYPLFGKKGAKVVTLKAGSIKEDIILDKFSGNDLKFEYEVVLPDELEARMEGDGSLGFYGPEEAALFGSVSTGSEQDAELLKKARKNTPKTRLLFRVPAPFIKETGKHRSPARTWYSLENNLLTIHASNLQTARYPISIDPSVYIETASKLMRGNNETNIEFDVDNELIQKGRTTGARFDEWLSTVSNSTSTWDSGTAVAGGFVYSVGGARTEKALYTTPGTARYVVPAGISSITVKTWGGGGGGGGSSTDRAGGAGGGGGYATATLAVTAGEVLYIYVGGGGKGGRYTASEVMGDGGSGGGYSGVFRSATPLLVAAGGGGGGGGNGDSGSTSRAAGSAAGAGGDTTSGVAGSGNGSTTGGGAGTSGAGGSAGSSSTTGGTAGSSLQGGTGASYGNTFGDSSYNGGGAGGRGDTGDLSADKRPGGGGGGGGYYGGGGGGRANADYNGGAGGGGGSSYVTGSGTSSSAGSGTTPGNSADSDRNGSSDGGAGGSASGPANGSDGDNGLVLVTATGSSDTATASVHWAKFNTSSYAVESPNPGAGSCTNWCTDSDYDLPADRIGLSLVAYNGFLYAIGGSDGTTRASTVYIAKLGANGEPALWHPTDTNKANWVYWYSSANTLSAGTSYMGAFAYNNRLYRLGGQTAASSTGITTVEYADLKPTGDIGSWTSTGMVALPSARHHHTIQQYNDKVYLIGGVSGAISTANLQSSVHWIKLASDGTMQGSWTATTSFSTARMSWGGNFSVIWGAYIYLAGGCTAITTGYCSTIASDIQLASINSDGTLTDWNTITNVTNQRMGFGLVAWRNALYVIGGCKSQDTGTGVCTWGTPSADYGAINQDGDASTVSNSVADGVAPCSGGSPYDCDTPPEGNGNGQGGRMSGATVVNNGYIYYFGGCTAVAKASVCYVGAAGKTSDTIYYASIAVDGTITRVSSCTGGSLQYVGSWCVDNTNTITGGLAAMSASVFNNVVYLVGGTDGSDWGSTVWRNPLASTGGLGTWSSQTFTNLDLGSARGYAYTFTRSNPSSAGTYPGNLYVLGGCAGSPTTDNGLDCTDVQYTEVYKCNIMTTGALEEADANDCTTTGQTQIDAEPGTGGSQGLGVMAGTVYANYVYLIGGQSPNETERGAVMYAKIDNSNNIVDADGESIVDNIWTTDDTELEPVRRRGVAFGYNGYLYALAGYNSGDTLNDLLFAKIDVSTGALDSFTESGVTVSPRWDLRAVVNNGYVYTIGGCSNGIPPQDCTSMTGMVQTFQLYNNYSGSPYSYSAGANLFTTDRIGASSAVYNGYIYVAGGCTSATDCTTATDNTQYAAISSTGAIGTWANTTDNTLPAVRAWGQLEVAGGTLYYIGGQDSTSTNEQSTVYYGTPSSGDISSWNTATNGLPAARTRHGATVWNNRLYVLGGLDSSAASTSTVYVSPQLNSGGDIGSAWSSSTAFNVARNGATAVAYANNLYLFGGHDGTNYLNDTQYTQINSDGTVDSWSYSNSLPGRLRDAEGFAANGFMYLIGGRSDATTCASNTIVAPISANTTIASGNNPTGLGEWYETNVKYTGDRYGASANYYEGKVYILGGGCGATITYTGANRVVQTTLQSQPQIAKYSRMIDTDTDVFPTDWLMNGLDNSIGARWTMKYRSMNDIDGVATDCGTADMSTWGQETNYGTVTLGTPDTYTPKDGSGNNINCARYYYFNVTIDSTQTYGYPDDVTRGPTIADLSLFFTADPSKRLRHGKTFTGGEKQPLDTPF